MQTRRLLATAPALRRSLAPATRALPKRVENPSSRVLSHVRTCTSHTPPNQVALRSTTLRSAFPTKTVIFLVVVSGLVYLFVEIHEVTWADEVLASFAADSNPTAPLHFYANKDELDHWLRFHVPDPSNTFKDPDVGLTLSANFSRLVQGWMLTEKESMDANLPVTHGCRFQSNDPCEDYFALGTSPGVGGKAWNYWSIMDGHAGFDTAVYLQQVLIPRVSIALSTLSPNSGPMQIEHTIKDAFLRLDKQIMEKARTAAGWFPAASPSAIFALEAALSGSCALLAAFDPEKNTLRVACTGDSRAVLGRWDAASNTYTSIPLSEDQTGFNPKEVARLAAAHPDEPDMIDPKTGRLHGIAITRAFGDHRWKWDNDFVKTVQAKFWATGPRPQSQTPPYMTAEPEVTETQIVRVDPYDENSARQGRKSDFLILASDGLWDRMSSEHAVECVARWLDSTAHGQGSALRDPHFLNRPFHFPPPNTPDPGVDMVDGALSWQATPEYFAIEDENAAVCLARNAMGGTRRGLFLGLLSVHAPWRRNAVDDTTVMVVFFDDLRQQQQQQQQQKHPPRAQDSGPDARADNGRKTRWWLPWTYWPRD